MTGTEAALVGRINQLTMMVFLQEMRAQVLRQQVVEANGVIVKATATIEALTKALVGGELHPNTIDGIC